jgi:hypothetical protein
MGDSMKAGATNVYLKAVVQTIMERFQATFEQCLQDTIKSVVATNPRVEGDQKTTKCLGISESLWVEIIKLATTMSYPQSKGCILTTSMVHKLCRELISVFGILLWNLIFVVVAKTFGMWCFDDRLRWL